MSNYDGDNSLTNHCVSNLNILCSDQLFHMILEVKLYAKAYIFFKYTTYFCMPIVINTINTNRNQYIVPHFTTFLVKIN